MSFYDAIRVGASGAADFEVERSLRFNDDDNAYLNRTPSIASNRTTFTLSVWVKRASNLDEFQRIFEAGADTSNRTYFTFDGDDKLEINHRDGGSEAVNLTTTARFRDVSAWYHIVLAIDTTQSTSSDRIKIYVNGTQQTAFDTSTYPSSSKELDINSTAVHYIGRSTNNTSKFDGYMAEFNFIDGSQLTPSSFGATDVLTGQWNPKKYTGSYGTNGFRLNFSDNSGTTATTLGKDSSGNGNNFTPNNFSVAAGEGNDSVEDTPTNNWATLNSLDPISNVTFSEGNLKAVRTNAGNIATSNFVVHSGKWYMEMKYVSGTSNHMISVGFSNPDRSYKRLVRGGDGELTPNTGNVSVTFADPDVLMLALDVDNGKWYIGKNGSYMLSGDPANGTGFVHSGLSSSDGFIFMVVNNTSDGGQTISANFGQQGFSYTPPTGFKAFNSQNLPDPTILLPNQYFNTVLYSGDGNATKSITGVGFKPDWLWLKGRNTNYSHLLYDAVRGAGSLKAINSNETRPEGSTVQDNSTFGFLNSFDSDGFSVTKGSDSTSYTNGGSSTYVAWNWDAGETDSATYTVKVVSDSGNKYRFNDFGTSAVTLDLAEGGTYTFDQSDSSMSSHPMQLSTTANGTHGGGSAYSTGVTYQLDGSTVTASAFISGFSSASSRKLIITVAASAPTLYYYCYYHSGMGGQANTNSTLGSSNFDGTLQATVKANPTAGFSIVTWTGNQTSGATLGHGLGVAPKTLFVKRRDGTSNWICPLFDEQKAGQLNTSTQFTNSYYNTFFTSQPSSTLLTIGSNDDINRNTSTYVAYVFSEVAGYSKIGKYDGNGSSNGAFVFTGFKVAFLLAKRMTGSGNGWTIIDNKRDVDNSVTQQLYPASSTSEASYDGVDFLANGFKMRQTNAWLNGSTDYYYLAFAESPFKNSRAR